MQGLPGADAATTLLRLLPAEAAAPVLAYLDPADAQDLRARLADAAPAALPAAEREAVTAFFDYRRILSRSVPPQEPRHVELKAPVEAAHSSPESDAADPVAALAAIDPAILARALADEQAATAALILGRFDAARAAEVIQRLPAARRSEVVVRLTQPAVANHLLVERLGRAVLATARGLAALPPEPSADERTRSLAAMLRRLGRVERAEVMAAIEKADMQAVIRIRQEMFRFDDLLKVEDRPLQGLIAELDAKTLALALKSAPEAIAEKILRNTSSRGRQALTDEIALLGNVPKQAIADAQANVVDVLRRLEEEGKLTIES